MRGAVAAGHTLTAEAGAEVLREGGNAVDACIAAAFMSWVTESTLTSPGGGGFLLVRAASTGKVRLYDFFVAIPGHGVERPVREMDLVDVEFDRGTSQIFRVGGASCAVPGAIAGLEEGGSLTEEDLAAYRVITRKPIRTSFGARAFVSNPPPSSGGTLIAYALLLFSRLGPGGPPGSAEAIARLAEVMREQTLARGGSFVGDLYRGGLPKRLFAGADEAAERIVARDLESGLASTEESVGAPGTTHISVVDAAGNAASLTASNGSGSGVIVPGTGIHLNNMLGEYDLNPIGRGNQRAAVGRRLTSMMAPSIVLEGERPRLVVGSAGSIRLRGAILQLVLNVTAHGMEVGAAIGQPRVHLEGRQVHCEGGFDPAELDRLEQRGYELVRWRRRNLYFGGAAAVELREDGTLDAAGDPRRDGHG